MRVAESTALVASISLLLCGCVAAKPSSSGTSAEMQTQSSPTSFDDGLLTYETSGEDRTINGMLSRWDGLLELAGGCLSVDEVPIVLPSGATWDGRTLRSEGEDFVLGDEVVLGGGRIEGMELARNTPEECRGAAPFVAVAIDFAG